MIRPQLSKTRDAFETQVALMRADIEEIRRTLYGDGKGRKGLANKVKELLTAADRGYFSFRVVLWLGGGIVTTASAIAQFREAIVSLFHP